MTSGVKKKGKREMYHFEYIAYPSGSLFHLILLKLEIFVCPHLNICLVNANKNIHLKANEGSLEKVADLVEVARLVGSNSATSFSFSNHQWV